MQVQHLYRSILENQSYPLYHGTDLNSLVGIFDSKVIDAGINRSYQGEPRGVSFTRDISTALRFVNHSGDIEGAVLVADRAVLRQRYRIVPFAYKEPTLPRHKTHSGAAIGPDLDEQEEIVLAREIPLSLIEHILIRPEWIRQMDDQFALEELAYNYDETIGQIKTRIEFILADRRIRTQWRGL